MVFINVVNSLISSGSLTPKTNGTLAEKFVDKGIFTPYLST
jgi:hypothetical protein